MTCRIAIFLVAHLPPSRPCRVWVRHYAHNDKHDLLVLSEGGHPHVQSLELPFPSVIRGHELGMGTTRCGQSCVNFTQQTQQRGSRLSPMFARFVSSVAWCVFVRRKRERPTSPAPASFAEGLPCALYVGWGNAALQVERRTLPCQVRNYSLNI